MNINRSTLLIIFVIAAAILGLLLTSNHLKNTTITTAESERKEKNALQIIIDSTANQHPVINESLKGKIVVINEWATWCPPCRDEIPELNKLVHDFKSDKIVFIALDEDDSLKESKIMEGKNIHFDYQQLFDQKEMVAAINSLRLSNEANAIPVNVVINPEGKIEFYYIGNQPEQLQNVRSYLTEATKSL